MPYEDAIEASERHQDESENPKPVKKRPKTKNPIGESDADVDKVLTRIEEIVNDNDENGVEKEQEKTKD